MGIEDDFSKLRGEGYSDDDILESYKGYDPQYSSDIDKLRKEGMSSKEILDGLASFRKTAPAPKEEPSELSQILPALQYGAGTKIEGLGSTIRNLGYGENGVEATGRDLKPKVYDPAMAKFMNPSADKAGFGGFGWKYLPRAVAEGAAGLGVDLSAGALTGGAGFLASNAASNLGPSLDARRLNNGATVDPNTGAITGGKELSAKDYAIAGGSTALQAYLGKLGMLGGKIPGLGGAIEGATNTAIKGAGLKAASQIPGVLAKSAVTEGISSAIGDAVQQGADTIGTDKGFSIDPHQSLGAGVVGGATGAGIRAAKVPGDLVNIGREIGTDQNSNIRVADRYAALENEIKNPKQQFGALDVVTKQIDSAITTGRKQARWLMSDPDEELTVREAVDTVKKGASLTDDQKTAISGILDRHEDGKLLKDSIIDADTNNRIKSRGKVSAKGDRFEGGLGSHLGDLVYPNRNVGKLLVGTGAASLAASKFALPALSQISIAAPIIGTGLGALTGASAGIKGLDAALGIGNPVARFRDQYSGMERNEPTRANALESPTEIKARTAVEQALAQGEALQSKADAAQQKRIDKVGEASVKRSIADAVKGLNKDTAEAAKAQKQKEAETSKALKRYRDLETGLADMESQAALTSERETAQEASRKAKETDKAWNEYKGSQKAPDSSTALSDRLWASREPKTPKEPRDLWSTAKDPENGRDWSDQDAERAIAGENTARLAGAKDALKESSERSRSDRQVYQEAERRRYADAQARQREADRAVKAAEKAKDAEAVKVAKAEQKVAQEALKAAEKASKAGPKQETAQTEDKTFTTDDLITVEHNGQKVVRDKSGIKNLSAYRSSTLDRMMTRDSVVNEARAITKTRQQDLDNLLERLNTETNGDWNKAQSHIEDFITDQDFDLQSPLWDWYNKNADKLKGTYERKTAR